MQIIDFLSELFNMLIVTGEIPEEWPVACVVEIHKEGDASLISSYHTILKFLNDGNTVLSTNMASGGLSQP